MNRRNLLMLVAGIGMLLAIVVLFGRVQELQRSVDSLAKQLPAQPQVISARAEEIITANQKRRPHYFKLIDAAAEIDGSSEVGVPWSVERAMMGDALQNRVSREMPDTRGSYQVVEPGIQNLPLLHDAAPVPANSNE